MNTEKKNYLKDVTKGGYLLIAFLIASLAMTAFVMSYDYSLFGIIFKHKSVLKYVIVIFSVFAAVTLLYLIISLKFKKATLADSFYLAMIIVGIAFFAYIGIAYGTFNARRIVVPSVAVFLGIVFTVVRVICYNKVNAEKVKAPANKIKSYYSDILNKFSFFAMIVAAGIAVCIIYKLFNEESNYRILKNDNFKIMTAVCLLPLIVYAVKGALVKTVTMFDALLLTGVITLPATLIQLLMRVYSEVNLGIWAVVVALYLICLLLRFIKYDPNAKRIAPICTSKCYVNALFKKHDMLLLLAISGVIAFIAMQLLCSRSLHTYLFENSVTLDKIDISLKALPTLVIAVSALAALGFFAIMALLGVKKKSVGIGDAFLAICTLYVLFGFITLVAYRSSLYLYGLIAFAAYCLILIVIRAIVVNKA